MREAHNVIIRPVVTEKTARLGEDENVYAFIVAKDANKIDITRAVQTLWDVTVLDVRTMRYAGKSRRSQMGRMNKSWNVGRTASFKKALVKLAEGDSIELYEGG